MKNIETKTLQQPQPIAAGKPSLEHEAGSDLAQRLWQMMLPLPQIADESAQAIGAAKASNSGATQGHTHDREQRDRDTTSQLASAAHLLASSVQQLGFVRYEQSDTNAEPSRASNHSATFNLRMSHAEAGSGHASLDISHAQLGDIALEIELSNGSVRVIASAQTELSARVLEAGQAELAARLLGQGIVLEGLEVVVAARSGSARKRKDSKRNSAGKQET